MKGCYYFWLVVAFHNPSLDVCYPFFSFLARSINCSLHSSQPSHLSIYTHSKTDLYSTMASRSGS